MRDQLELAHARRHVADAADASLAPDLFEPHTVPPGRTPLDRRRCVSSSGASHPACAGSAPRPARGRTSALPTRAAVRLRLASRAVLAHHALRRARPRAGPIASSTPRCWSCAIVRISCASAEMRLRHHERGGRREGQRHRALDLPRQRGRAGQARPGSRVGSARFSLDVARKPLGGDRERDRVRVPARRLPPRRAFRRDRRRARQASRTGEPLQRARGSRSRANALGLLESAHRARPVRQEVEQALAAQGRERHADRGARGAEPLGEHRCSDRRSPAFSVPSRMSSRSARLDLHGLRRAALRPCPRPLRNRGGHRGYSAACITTWAAAPRRRSCGRSAGAPTWSPRRC